MAYELKDFLKLQFPERLSKALQLADCDLNHISDFLQTPYFKTLASTRLQALDQGEEWGAHLHVFLFTNYVRNVSVLSRIWPDSPNDHFQTYQKLIESISLGGLYSNNGVNLATTECLNWLGNNLSLRSFLNMLSRVHGKQALVTIESELRDTLEQLDKILRKSSEPVPRPRRWRLRDFHDHISALYIERSTGNTKYCNDLISTPYRKDNYKVFQPADTVELGKWGREVKNCVLSREDRILNGESRIILIEEEERPKYTVQLRGDPENFTIEEIEGPCHSSLTPEQVSMCTSLIKEAAAASAERQNDIACYV
jgi:hypothetical protein